MAILKNRVIYYGGIPEYTSCQQAGRLILNEKELLFSAPGCPGNKNGYYRIPLSKIIRVKTVKEYLPVWIRVYLSIEYLDEKNLLHRLRVRMRDIGWPRVLKKSQRWTDRLNDLTREWRKT